MNPDPDVCGGVQEWSCGCSCVYLTRDSARFQGSALKGQ